QGIVDEIGDDAPQREPISEYAGLERRLGSAQLYRLALRTSRRDLGAHQLVALDQLFVELTCAGAARQQRIVQQPDHVRDVLGGSLPLDRVRDELRAQPQAR